MIYVTPFKNSTKQCSGPSTDSGFEDLEAVAAAMGPPDIKTESRTLIYGAGEERVIFSYFIFCIDVMGNTG